MSETNPSQQILVLASGPEMAKWNDMQLETEERSTCTRKIMDVSHVIIVPEERPEIIS